MKKFLRKVFFFIVIFLLVSLLIQLLVDMRIRNKVLRGMDTLDARSAPGTDLVFLGSSRCYDHFDPALFEKELPVRATNLGVEGHSELPMHELRLLNYLAKNKPPRFAILSFDPLVESGSAGGNRNMVNKNVFARYAFFPSASNGPVVDYFQFDPLEKYVPLYAFLKYKLFPECITLPNDKAWHKNRYNRSDQQWNPAAHPVPALQALTRYYFDTTASGVKSIQDGLRSLDSLCRLHSIRLICVQTPVYGPFYQQANFACTGKICSSLNIPFFDISKGPVKEDIANFYDADHLNTKGVAAMTAELLSEPAFRQLFGDGSQPIRKD